MASTPQKINVVRRLWLYIRELGIIPKCVKDKSTFEFGDKFKSHLLLIFYHFWKVYFSGPLKIGNFNFLNFHRFFTPVLRVSHNNVTIVPMEWNMVFLGKPNRDSYHSLFVLMTVEDVGITLGVPSFSWSGAKWVPAPSSPLLVEDQHICSAVM